MPVSVERCRSGADAGPVRDRGDYIDPADGLRHCGKCGGAKEAWFPAEVRAFTGMDRRPAECPCAAREREQREVEDRERLRRNRIQRLRAEAFRDLPGEGWRFETAPVRTPALEKARQYACRWDDFSREQIGLLLFGDVGTGKTFAAGCIANALIDREVSVRCVSCSQMVDRMQNARGEERERYLRGLTECGLLLLDDLGAERSTSYGRERVLDLVDRRLLSGRPMLVTTNLPLSALREASGLEERRIYDRVLEMGAPLRVSGESFRRGKGRARTARAAALFNER